MVLIRNADVTIYHLNPKTQLYTRTNIDGVNWNSRRNATVSDKGVNVAYTTMIVADNGKVDTGDKVVKGNISLDITKLSDLKDYTVLTVVSVQGNNIMQSINIECK